MTWETEDFQSSRYLGKVASLSKRQGAALSLSWALCSASSCWEDCWEDCFITLGHTSKITPVCSNMKSPVGFDQSWVTCVHECTLHLCVNRLYSSSFSSLLFKTAFCREREHLVLWYPSWLKNLWTKWWPVWISVCKYIPDLTGHCPWHPAVADLGGLKRSLPTSAMLWLNKLIYATPGKTVLVQFKLSVLIIQLLLGSEQRQKEVTTCLPDAAPLCFTFLPSAEQLRFFRQTGEIFNPFV